MLTYQDAAQAPRPTELIQYALPWVIEAGNPYYTVLFGDPESPARVLGTWMRRSSSEISIARVRFLVCESELAGGYIALGGGELRKARKSDGIALLTGCRPEDRPALMQRLASVSDLFSPVDDDEYYLSKLGLQPQFRGRKLTQALVRHYIEEGRIGGYTRYRLDVQAGNAAAIRAYSSAGFQIYERAESRNGPLKYHSMRYELVGS